MNHIDFGDFFPPMMFTLVAVREMLQQVLDESLMALVFVKISCAIFGDHITFIKRHRTH